MANIVERERARSNLRRAINRLVKAQGVRRYESVEEPAARKEVRMAVNGVETKIDALIAANVGDPDTEAKLRGALSDALEALVNIANMTPQRGMDPKAKVGDPNAVSWNTARVARHALRVVGEYEIPKVSP
jgi:hypothetical protein